MILDTDPPVVGLAAIAGAIGEGFSNSVRRDDDAPANVVDGLFAIAHAIERLADAIENGIPEKIWINND